MKDLISLTCDEINSQARIRRITPQQFMSQQMKEFNCSFEMLFSYYRFSVIRRNEWRKQLRVWKNRTIIRSPKERKILGQVQCDPSNNRSPNDPNEGMGNCMFCN